MAPGFARVQRGESVETFAQRLLGDANRWPELWDLNKDHEVGPDGEVWTAPWKLGAGWDLRLPPDAVPVEPIAASGARGTRPAVVVPIASAWTHRENLTVVDEYEVVDGDSYWGIAERFLPDGSPARDVWEFTQALMAFNAPRLGYAHPAMLHPGDVVDIVTPAGTQRRLRNRVRSSAPRRRRPPTQSSPATRTGTSPNRRSAPTRPRTTCCS